MVIYIKRRLHKLINIWESKVSSNQELRDKIKQLVKEYADTNLSAKPFNAGESVIPPSGKVIGDLELMYMTDAVLDGWLTTGRFNTLFEEKLGQFLGLKHVLTTNSGSSANLLAFSALTSDKLGDRAIKLGDEVISVAAGFPTTVNPI
ncbi:MAG: DegT/DnrJ/EryC1/StrS family aminotransferase, partial [Burkholderiales bacterium]|nr:DegT/DnrJ/EryC1/StrS family aminotransferase [Burkholderiales bacterium]